MCDRQTSRMKLKDLEQDLHVLRSIMSPLERKCKQTRRSFWQPVGPYREPLPPKMPFYPWRHNSDTKYYLRTLAPYVPNPIKWYNSSNTTALRAKFDTDLQDWSTPPKAGFVWR